jgi:hypothetical protein
MNGQSSSLSKDRLEKLKEVRRTYISNFDYALHFTLKILLTSPNDKQIGFVFRVRPDKTEKHDEGENNVDLKEPSTGRKSNKENRNSSKEDAPKTEGVETRRTTRSKQRYENISTSTPTSVKNNSSSSPKDDRVELNSSGYVEDVVGVETETGPKNDNNYKGSTSGKNKKERSNESEPKIKKKMILSSESEHESSDEDSVSSSSSDDSDSEESSDDDSQHNSGSISSDQYEKSDDEIPLAVPTATKVVQPPMSAQKSPEPNIDPVDKSHSGTTSEPKVESNKQNTPSPPNNDETSGKKQRSPKSNKRGNQHLSKAGQEDQNKRAKSVGQKAE